jgi:hypothetical protein
MKSARTAVVLCAVLAACGSPGGSAQDAELRPPSRPSFVLDTDMLRFDAPSSSFFIGWHRVMYTLGEAGLDGVTGSLHLDGPEQWPWRVGILAAFEGAETVASRAFSITAHDARHMQAARAIGASPVGLVQSDTGQDMTIWQFFIESFNPTTEAGLYVWTMANPTLDQEAYVAGIGLDTNMLIAESIGSRINQGEGHVADCAPYVLNKLWGITYFMETGPTSDAETYLGILNSEGYSAATRDAVIFLSTASCLLSGGFLSLARGAWDYIVDARSTVEPLGITVGDVRLFWPEVTTWLNPRCVSLQASMDAAWRRTVLVRCAVDAPVLGDLTTPEVTVGSTVWLSRLGLGMEVTTHFDGFPFLKGRAELRLSDALSAGVEGFYGQGTTMRELREYPSGPGLTGFLQARL